MIRRCLDENFTGWKNYGGRGITVHTPWKDSFALFLEDMGPCPSPAFSIDRINNDGNYEPGNCRWASKSEQSRNTRRNIVVEINGIKKCITDWAIERGVNPLAIYQRIHRGMTPLEAVTKPFRNGGHK